MSRLRLNVIYVENDAALRGLVKSVLKSKEEVLEVFDFATAEEAIKCCYKVQAQVALLDVSLGFQAMDGVALGKQLKLINEDIGIVLFTQHPISAIAHLVNLKQSEAWSYFQKRADSNLDHLVEVMQNTSRGESVIVDDSESTIDGSTSSVSATLSVRQHVIFSQLASGAHPKEIGKRLGISAESVRQDLSKAYAILVPNPKPGMDLRVAAILSYQKLTNKII